MGVIETHRDQMFPRLTPPRRTTALRFASDVEQTFGAGELLYGSTVPCCRSRRT